MILYTWKMEYIKYYSARTCTNGIKYVELTNKPVLVTPSKIIINQEPFYSKFLNKKMNDSYEGLSDEELREIFEDMEADYWIDYYKSNPE